MELMIPKSPSWLLMVLASQMAMHRPMQPIQEPAQLLDTYDFIVVGAGTSGSVLANRLSSVPDWKVLVLEAGDEPEPMTEVPVLARDNWGTAADWNYTTVKQSKACKSMGGMCYMSRGKVLGGTSSINLMMYVRGNKEDYDSWDNKFGKVGWSYDEVMEKFVMAEDARANGISGGQKRGKGGPLPVDFPTWSSPLQQAYMEAGKEMGYQQVDYNAGVQTGIAMPQFMMDKGARASTAKAYLREAASRPNLHILKNAMVTKVVFNADNKAESVEYMKDGKMMSVMVGKEVMLAAGSINSAKLLMLSGVGPKKHLEKLGIKVVVDSPVGKNLQDQISVPIQFRVKEGVLTRSAFENNDTATEWAASGAGPLSSPVGIEALGFFNLKKKSDVPDVQMVVMSYMPTPDSQPLMVITTNKLRPESRGTVMLNSADPADPPLIDPKYFSAGSDFQDTVDACVLSAKFAMSKALSKFGLKVDNSMMPMCAKAKQLPEICRCLTENYSNSMYMSSGTAVMAPPKMKAESVVCARLRVHGVQGVRVVDTSIMPTITSGDTTAPTVMIGEMAADFIIKQYNS